MKRTAVRWLGCSLIVAAGVLATACADAAPLGPVRQLDARIGHAATAGDARRKSQSPNTASCENVSAPEGSKLSLHVFAQGAQIYRWSGTSWTFVAPLATLSADAAGNSKIGIHYAGPTWESNSGSKVVGTVLQRCAPNANAIPWLLLGAVASEGPGVFNGVAYIQRVNTVGGTAPLTAGTIVGETVNVPYTAEYFYYRTK